jgi:small subunit ribosomal protein S16
VNKERAIDWLKKGAQPTNTVNGIFKKAGVLAEFKSAK